MIAYNDLLAIGLIKGLARLGVDVPGEVSVVGVDNTLLAAVIGALTSLSDRQKRVFGWWLVAGAVWLVLASTAKVLHARSEDRERKRTREHDGLHAALHVLFATVCAAAGKPVIVAGSIDRPGRVADAQAGGAAGFTIGTAALAGRFPARSPALADQLAAILACARRPPAAPGRD